MRKWGWSILAMLAFGCGDKVSKQADLTASEVTLSGRLNDVLLEFHGALCQTGVPSIRLHSFCENEVAEIWCTYGWADLQEEKPTNYTEVGGFTFLVFNSSAVNHVNILSDSTIASLVGNQLKEDVGLPPATGFPDTWLYRLNYHRDYIYSMVDSLFKYEDEANFTQNLYEYTGKVICY